MTVLLNFETPAPIKTSVVSGVSGVSKVSGVLGVSGISGVSGVSEVSGVFQVSGVLQPLIRNMRPSIYFTTQSRGPKSKA